MREPCKRGDYCDKLKHLTYLDSINLVLINASNRADSIVLSVSSCTAKP